MKTYTVLYAEDVPHYGVETIEAADDAAAIEAAKNFDFSGTATDPAYENAGCRRIVHIDDSNGRSVAEGIVLDGCFLRYGGETEKLLCAAAADMLAALRKLCAAKTEAENDPVYALNAGIHEQAVEEAFAAARAAIAKATGGDA